MQPVQIEYIRDRSMLNKSKLVYKFYLTKGNKITRNFVFPGAKGTE